MFQAAQCNTHIFTVRSVAQTHAQKCLAIFLHRFFFISLHEHKIYPPYANVQTVAALFRDGCPRYR